MTEDEAKTKICCGPPQVAAQMMRARPAYCAGSACMAWRWLPKCGENPNNPAEAMSLPPTEGYCGLAGRP
jgi:hypothetical protein